MGHAVLLFFMRTRRVWGSRQGPTAEATADGVFTFPRSIAFHRPLGLAFVTASSGHLSGRCVMRLDVGTGDVMPFGDMSSSGGLCLVGDMLVGASSSNHSIACGGDVRGDSSDAATTASYPLAGMSTVEGQTDGPALSALLFVGDWGSIRLVHLETTAVRTLAGGGRGFRDGPSEAACMSSISGIAVAPSSTMYFTDWDNNSLRTVDAAGTVVTVQGGQGIAHGICLGPDDGLLVVYMYEHAVRLLSPDGPGPSPRYRLCDHHEFPAEFRAVVLTVLVVARGQSARLQGVDAARGLRLMLNHALELLMRAMQVAANVWIRTPRIVFEDLRQIDRQRQ
eukprot:c10818_g2_i1.p1 GENE.c10818_g2_i1~~c10818_g2_i1.p1  ORF type:complete len:337 (-),score=30.79 c10818_g2_i1:545-1555(-)